MPLDAEGPPAPDPKLQDFSQLRAYLQRGRVAWRESPSGVCEELRCEEGRGDPRPFPLRRVWAVGAPRFHALLESRFRDQLRQHATSALKERDPRASAHRVLTPNQALFLVAVLVGAVAAFAFHPLATLIAINGAATAYFMAVIGFRFYLAAIALNLTESRRDPPMLAEDELPIVTILLPLFREAHAIPALLSAVGRLDYPPEKLDVKLLLEESDGETLAEARKIAGERFQIMVIPPSHPQTKPKACNYGLYCARGRLIVVYDAEDQPEPDQIRKAAAAFAAGGDDLACVQARLNFYNADENWLTRLFTLEYSLWFDSLLPALEHLRAPIPLGGTSNFFRTDALLELGGWDPYNVTEDADLGLRLARRGWRTAIIDSTTFEEANCELANWLRQRSRWMKGYIQTWLVHMRAPFAARARAGWRGFASAHLFVAGNAFSALINPFLWSLFVYWLFTRSEGVDALFPGFLLHLNLFALLFGNFLFIYLAMVAPLRRGWPQLALSAILIPVYWWLSSLAAYRALGQLATRPFFWEKTEHGLSAEAKARRAAALRQSHGHVC